MASVGVVLRPTDVHPAIGLEQAKEIGSRGLSGHHALEAVLAQCELTVARTLFDGPCYAVAVDPSGDETSGPPGSPLHRFTWSFAIVDARSGDFVRGFEGTG
jgi:hypothetical protein